MRLISLVLRPAGERIDRLAAERDIRQLDAVRGALRVRDRAHERLVAVLDVAVHHVEVPLVDRQVDRLADRAAGMVQRVRHVGELDEVAEVLDAGVAAAFVEVVYERRAVGRREHRRVAADVHAARRVARVLDEFARRRALHERATHAAREAHALAVDVGAGRLPELQGLGILPEDRCRSPRGSSRRCAR